MAKIPNKFYLKEDEIPTHWYNIRADMKELPDCYIDANTKSKVTKDDLCKIFPDKIVMQELDDKIRYVKIPDKIYQFYKLYRPSPLIRAYSLEKFLNTPAKIYYKFEGNNTSGSHKLNSAIAQAYYAKEEGINKLTTETGSGQWGTALSQACAYLDMDLTVFMVRSSYEQKPNRKIIMRSFGSKVIPSPSDQTSCGQEILKNDKNINGSLGCAISEAVESAVNQKDCKYALGSVLNHVILHQSIIGLECERAMDIIGEYPDIIIGCAGGGSNLAGLIAPFVKNKIVIGTDTEIIAVEPASCPTLTKGKYAYDYCDTGKITPLARMYTLGSGFMPSADHAGGLRYHGMSPIISKLYHDGYIKAVSKKQTEVFKAAIMFSKYEGILPAPESSYAISEAIDKAIWCRENNVKKTILFGLTGTGYFDLSAYESYMDGKLSDNVPNDSTIKENLKNLPKI